jgi:hypothetical protein
VPPVLKGGQGYKEANIVSLVGGVIVAIGVFVLALLIIGDPSPVSLAIAGGVALAVGIYVRVADM